MASARGPSRHHECALCMEAFTSPRLLPCFHTFCLGCLKRLVQTRPAAAKTFRCPTCRKTVTIPDGGVDRFQVNFYLEAEAEGEQAGSGSSARACDMCQKDPATHKCTDCDQLACAACVAVHASIAVTRSHTVVGLKRGEGSVTVTKERFCATHKGERLRFFCSPCSLVICRDCKLTSHEGHATVDLSVRSSEAKKLVLQVTERSRGNLEPKLRQQLKEAGEHQKSTGQKKADMLAVLEQRAGELKNLIDQSLSQAKQQLSQQTDDVNRTLTACIDAMNMELAAYLSLMEHAARVADGGCEADILEMPKLLTQFFEGDMTQNNAMSRPSTGRRSPQKRIPMHIIKKGPCESECQLKSFTETKWKTVVQIKEDTILCTNCRIPYGRKNLNCPSCGFAKNSQSGYNSAYGHIQQRAQQSSVCRYCGGSAAADIWATMQEAVPDYIGHVVKTEADGGKSGAKQMRRLDAWYSVQQPQSQGQGSLSSQISAEISAIQSCLSAWQRGKQENPGYWDNGQSNSLSALQVGGQEDVGYWDSAQSNSLSALQLEEQEDIEYWDNDQSNDLSALQLEEQEDALFWDND